MQSTHLARPHRRRDTQSLQTGFQLPTRRSTSTPDQCIWASASTHAATCPEAGMTLCAWSGTTPCKLRDTQRTCEGLVDCCWHNVTGSLAPVSTVQVMVQSPTTRRFPCMFWVLQVPKASREALKEKVKCEAAHSPPSNSERVCLQHGIRTNPAIFRQVWLPGART